MLIEKGTLEGVFEITLEPHEDGRGFFMRTYDDKVFRNYGLHQNWVQENHSYSKKKGTLRGLHFQFPPYTETKLVRVISGEVYDVVVDLRIASSTFGEWDSFVLSADNKKMIYIPRGFAHGVCALTDNCIMLYKVDNYYTPEREGNIRWDDSDIGIDWPLDGEPIISAKDKNAKSFKEFIETVNQINQGNLLEGNIRRIF